MTMQLKNFLGNKRKETSLPFRLNLQYFADQGEDDPEDGSDGGADPKTLELSEEELQSKIDSETDKRISKALETAKAKWKQEYEEKLEKEKQEAERLAKLTAKEREEAELEKREKELNEREAKLNRKQLESDAVANLREKDLPETFVSFVVAEDAETTLENINSLKEAFDKAVNEQVKEAIKQDVPGSGGGSSKIKNPFSKEHFNLTEQGRLLKDDPELYKKFKAQAE